MHFTLLQTQQQARPHITRHWGGSASLSFRQVLAMGKPHSLQDSRSPGARPVSKLTPLLGQLLQSQSSILPTIDAQIHLYNPRFQDHASRVSKLSHTPPMFLRHDRWTLISPEDTSSTPFPMPQTHLGQPSSCNRHTVNLALVRPSLCIPRLQATIVDLYSKLGKPNEFRKKESLL